MVGDHSRTCLMIPKLTLREVELPGKDEADMFNAGQHPWSLENGTESNLLLFNHSKDKATFEVEIDKDDVSWDKHYTLNPKQTLALDIRTLINNSVPDDREGSFIAQARASMDT